MSPNTAVLSHKMSASAETSRDSSSAEEGHKMVTQFYQISEGPFLNKNTAFCLVFWAVVLDFCAVLSATRDYKLSTVYQQ